MATDVLLFTRTSPNERQRKKKSDVSVEQTLTGDRTLTSVSERLCSLTVSESDSILRIRSILGNKLPTPFSVTSRRSVSNHSVVTDSEEPYKVINKPMKSTVHRVVYRKNQYF